MRGSSARRGSYITGSGAGVMVALAVVTNYVTASVPKWAEEPLILWSVFGTLAVATLVLQVWGRRLDANSGGPVGRPVAVGRIVAGATDSLAAPVPRRAVRGRDAVVADLERLLDGPRAGWWRLSRGAGPAAERFAVVTGAGGMGKTTVATALAQRMADRGTPVFWISWRTVDELAERMVQVAVACGLPEEDLEAARAGRVSLADTVWAHLTRAGRWLIVLDNLDDPDALTRGSGPVHEYRGWLRPSPTGLLLVTSRVTDPVVWGGGAHLIRLDPLPEQDGGLVLHDRVPKAGDLTEARSLSERLGGLPLALQAAARYLSAPGSRYRTFAAYQAALDEELGALLGTEHPRANDPEVARTIVGRTWERSLDQLEADGNALARPVLRLLSLLAPAPVPFLSCVTPELVTEATGLPATPVAVEAAINGLHTYGLLEVAVGADGQPVPGLVVLHPLVREVTALTVPQDENASAVWHHALASRISWTIDAIVGGELSDDPTVRYLARHSAAVAALSGNSNDIGLLRQLLALQGVLSERRVDAEALVLSQYTASAFPRFLGPDHLDSLASRNNLAATLWHLGRYQEAADLLRQNLDDYLRVLGPDHPSTLTSRSNLAAALNNLGRYQEAADPHQQALDDCLRVLGPDHPSTLSSRNNLAAALNNLGRYQEAADLLRQGLDDCLRVLGPDHPSTLISRSNLAAALSHLGRDQEAVDLHRQTLDDRTRVLGPDHPSTLISRSNLAAALNGLGRYQEAVDLHRQTLDDRTLTLGPDHPDTLTSRNNLAFALNGLGRHQEAVDLHRQTLDDRTLTLGPDHPDTLTSRNNLATSQAALGQGGRWYRRFGSGR
ncbi:tetratricopeptide repeat protein [Streptomyces sp. JNUCC 64]